MRRLMFIAPALGIGGLQFHLVRLVNDLARNGYPVTILLLSRQAELASQLEPAVTCAFVPGRSSNPRTWLKLWQEIRHRDPEVIIGWSTFPSLILCVLKAFGLRMEVVATELNYPPLAYGIGWKANFMHALTKRLYGHADQINANSGETVRYLQGRHLKSRVVRILNPVELADAPARVSADEAWRQAPLKILTVGRLLNRHKGFDKLLQAMHIVHETVPEAKLLIVGEGPDRPELEKMINDLALSNIVFLHGADTSMKPLLDMADIFVVSSNYEGFPNVLIEAMMAGRVTVSTDCLTGPSEIIEDRVNGYLAKVGDPRSLASNIIEASLLPTTAREVLGEKARAATSIFTVENAGIRYVHDVLGA